MSDRKIIEYNLIVLSSDESMNHYINPLIKDGWQPLGGIDTHICNDVIYYAQVMVKYAE